ncbi:MAG: hypothetical protein WC645_08315 [Candidatus Margulisiibacteriota bacterium]
MSGFSARIKYCFLPAVITTGFTDTAFDGIIAFAIACFYLFSKYFSFSQPTRLTNGLSEGRKQLSKQPLPPFLCYLRILLGRRQWAQPPLASRVLGLFIVKPLPVIPNDNPYFTPLGFWGTPG